jgi:hypothetical protein
MWMYWLIGAVLLNVWRVQRGLPRTEDNVVGPSIFLVGITAPLFFFFEPPSEDPISTQHRQRIHFLSG